MSIYEKIGTAAIGLLVLVVLVFSFREFKEPEHESEQSLLSRFSQSIGPNLQIGAFSEISEQKSSGVAEEDCEPLRPIILGVLHDIKERLEHMKTYVGVEDPFEVNEATLLLLCDTTAEITLADASGNKLLLQKEPFTRMVPQNGGPDDIGTRVRINATVIPAGASAPTEPTTFGEVLIPDRFLDTATSSLRQ